MTAHKVILVREWDAQVTGSGCCGRLGGRDTALGDPPEAFAHNRRETEAMGGIYQALRAGLRGRDVEITVADPRNTAWLPPALFLDARRHGLSPREIWATVTSGVSYNSIVLDGRVLFSGRIPTPGEAVAAVEAGLEGAHRAGR
jgi:hypothetical protein